MGCDDVERALKADGIVLLPNTTRKTKTQTGDCRALFAAIVTLMMFFKKGCGYKVVIDIEIRGHLKVIASPACERWFTDVM